MMTPNELCRAARALFLQVEELQRDALEAFAIDENVVLNNAMANTTECAMYALEAFVGVLEIALKEQS